LSAIKELKELYANHSKHSNYQILSEKLSQIIGKDEVEISSRYERERFNYIMNNINVKDKNVLDIGGNTGFFSFEALEAGANSVHYFEGDASHSAFVSKASESLGYGSRAEVTNGYYLFDSPSERKYDITFLLNVLHHVGDDYGDNKISIESAKKTIGEQLRNVAQITEVMVFQLGFCWKGNRNLGLFENGTKSEQIDFVTSMSNGVFLLEQVGVPVKRDGKIVYADLDEVNALRDDSLGEFLNRPLFILRSVA